jgi:hypothetical protein
VAERKEWLRSFAYGEEAGKNKSKDCFLRFVEQFNGLFANGKARDPNQAPDAKQILQLLAEPSLGELPLKARHAFRRHWHDLSDMADPVMIPLAQSQLAVGLKEQPVCKPKPPLESVVKRRLGETWLSDPHLKRRLQRGPQSLDRQLTGDLAVSLRYAVVIQGKTV